MSIFKRTQRKYVKKAYRVRNWREYEAGLRNRGSLTVWISLTAGSSSAVQAAPWVSYRSGIDLRQHLIAEAPHRTGSFREAQVLSN